MRKVKFSSAVVCKQKIVTVVSGDSSSESNNSASEDEEVCSQCKIRWWLYRPQLTEVR